MTTLTAEGAAIIAELRVGAGDTVPEGAVLLVTELMKMRHDIRAGFGARVTAVHVAVGDEVEQGEVIGAVGATGRATGPHLHWGLVVDEVAVNPSQWLDQAFLEPPPTDG